MVSSALRIRRAVLFLATENDKPLIPVYSTTTTSSSTRSNTKPCDKAKHFFSQYSDVPGDSAGLKKRQCHVDGPISRSYKL